MTTPPCGVGHLTGILADNSGHTGIGKNIMKDELRKAVSAFSISKAGINEIIGRGTVCKFELLK